MVWRFNSSISHQIYIIMKIRKKDKKRISRKIRRDSHLDALDNGMDIRSKPYKNKKKYTRKSKYKADHL